MSTPIQAKSVRFTQFGPPAEVLSIAEEAVSQPAEGQVLIEFLAASINPADINLIEGTYGVKPALPATPGNEGVGVVVAVGSGVTRLKTGDWVRPPEGVGVWRQYVCANAADCIKLPSGIPAEQAAMIFVNPPTAWRMTHDFVDLKPGDWIIQNAANSAVGQCVIQIAKAKGWKTINLVRRAELADGLKAIGADLVFVDEPGIRKKLAEMGDKKSIRLGLNAVGGESALNVMDCLSPGGSLVTYGAMSKQALKVPNKFLIFSNITFCGFWMTRWYRQASLEAKEALLAEIGNLIRDGKLSVKVEKSYPLDQVKEAVIRAQEGSRGGKILLNLKGA